MELGMWYATRDLRLEWRAWEFQSVSDPLYQPKVRRARDLRQSRDMVTYLVLVQ